MKILTILGYIWNYYLKNIYSKIMKRKQAEKQNEIFVFKASFSRKHIQDFVKNCLDSNFSNFDFFQKEAFYQKNFTIV